MFEVLNNVSTQFAFVIITAIIVAGWMMHSFCKAWAERGRKN